MSRLNSTFLSLAPVKLWALKAVNSPTQSQFKFETRMISDDTLGRPRLMKSAGPRFAGKLQLQASQFSPKYTSVAINFSSGMERKEPFESMPVSHPCVA